MAGAAVIGALRVVIGADSAALDKGLADASSKLKDFGAGIGKMGAAAAAAFAAIGVGVAAAVKSSINEADKLGKMAQSIGIPVEQLSGLRLAADLSGVSLESLGKSVAKLSRTMVEAAAKPTSEAANAFKALGVSVTNTDGTLKGSQQVLTDIAGKFEGLKDGAGKTAVSMAIFGRSGADLIPLLNAGKQGLQGMIEEAAQLGIVIDSKTSKSAEAFNDNLTRLSKVKEGIIIQVASRMLPAFQNLSQVLVDAAKNSSTLDFAAKALTITMQTLVSAAVVVAASFKVAADNIVAVARALAQASSGDFVGAWESIKQGVGDTTETIVGAGNALKTLWTGVPEGANAAAGATDNATKSLKEFNFAALGGKNALDQFLSSQQKSIAAHTADAAATGAAIGVKERLRVVLQAYQVAATNNIPITGQLAFNINKLGTEAETAALKLAAASLKQETLLPWELHAQQLERINQLYAAGQITAETFKRASAKAAESTGQSWDIAASSITGSFAQAAAQFGKTSSTMAAISKALAVVQAGINAYSAASKALATYPPPLSYIAAGAALAQGLAYVASIKSQSVPKFATGGAFNVGGAGGVDSQMVPFMASPGERVTVDQNKYGEGGARGSVTSVPIVLRGRSFDRQDIESVITGLNSAFSDGYKLKVQAA